MKTVLQSKDNATDPVLYMAMELSNKKWKLGFSNGERIRVVTLAAGDWADWACYSQPPCCRFA